MSETKITKQLDYSASSRVDPHYKFHRVPPKAGTGNVILTTAGGSESEFDLPQRVFNLSRSTLSFTATPPASGAGNYNYQQMDAMTYIDGIKLSTESGLDICDIKFVNNMTKIVWKPETKLEKYLSLESHGGGVGAGSMLQPCRVTNKLKLTDSETEYKAAFVDGYKTSAQLIAENKADAADTVAWTQATGTLVLAGTITTASFGVGDIVLFNAGNNALVNLVVKSITNGTTMILSGAGGANEAATDIATNSFTIYKGSSLMAAAVKRPATEARRHDDVAIADGTGAASAVNVAFDEAKYFTNGAANTATPVIKVKIDLGMIYNSIFEVDKDILFDKITTVKITWAPSTKIYYFGDDALSPGGGVIAAAAGDVTISALHLYLAMEQNPDIVAAIKAKVASGSFSFLFPSTRVYKRSVTAAGPQSISRKFNRAFGLRLQRVYHAVFNNEETKNTAYDHDNRADAKLSLYNTSLDSQNLYEFDIKTGEFEDYMTLKAKLEGSAILNSDVYKYNWFHCEDFTGSTAPLWDKDHNREAGLDLTIERTFDINMTVVPANTQHYSVFVFQRRLKVSSMETIME